MPVNEKQTSGEVLYQRPIYERGGISRWYWDYKDNLVLRNLSASDRVIYDIGCGEGILLEKLSRLAPGAEVTGIDCMPENIAICRAHGLNARLGDLYHLEIADASVDVVFLIEVIEHLLDHENALKEMMRVLKPGGKLVILFPHDAVFAFARFATFKFKEWRYDPGHVKRWTHRDLNATLRGLGMNPVLNRSIPFLVWGLSLHGLCVAVKPAEFSTPL